MPRSRARNPERRPPARLYGGPPDVPPGQHLPHVPPKLLQLPVRRRVGPHEALGGPVGAERQRDPLLYLTGPVPEDELRRTSPEVHDHDLLWTLPERREGAPEAELGLLLPGDEAHLEPRRLPHPLHELVAVRGVPDRARGEHLGREGAVQGGYSGEKTYGLGREQEPLLLQAPRLLDAGPEPGREFLPCDGQDLPALHLPHEEVDRVRTNVYDPVTTQIPRPPTTPREHSYRP